MNIRVAALGGVAFVAVVTLGSCGGSDSEVVPPSSAEASIVPPAVTEQSWGDEWREGLRAIRNEDPKALALICSALENTVSRYTLGIFLDQAAELNVKLPAVGEANRDEAADVFIEECDRLRTPGRTSTPTAEAKETPLTNRRDCGAIRGTEYRSPGERTWFLDNCLSDQTGGGEIVDDGGVGEGLACHASYVGACLDPNAVDYDCAGGSGDGPLYVGQVTVVGPDVFDLDTDGDGIGCEGGPGPPQPPPPPPPQPDCDPSYPGVCIPPPPPGLNCADIPFRDFVVLPPDPHGFDGDGDGIGCEG